MKLKERSAKKNGAVFRSVAFYSLFIFWAALTFSSALAEISFVAALIGWCLWKAPQKFKLDLPPRSIWIPLAGFFVWVLLSWAFSEYPSKSFRGVTKILQQVLIFFLVFDLFRSRRALGQFEKFFLGVAWVILLDGLFQYSFEKDFLRGRWSEDSGAGYRLSASFGSYGKFASYLICALPYLATLAFYYRKEQNDGRRFVLAFLLLCGSLGLLFLTRSRGAILALTAALVLMLLLKRKFVWLILFLSAALGAVSLLPKHVVIHLDVQRKEQSLVERYHLWKRALDVIRAKPVFGTGINTYAVAHQKYDRRGNWRVRNYYAHNGYLQTAAEIGLPGLLFFLIFLMAYFFHGFRHPEEPSWKARLRAGLLTGLMSFLAFSAGDTVFHSAQPVMTFWFLLGLQLAYRESVE